MHNDPDRPWLDTDDHADPAAQAADADEGDADEGDAPDEPLRPSVVRPRGSALAGAAPVYIFRIRVASNLIEVLELRGKEGRNLHVVDPESQTRTVILDAGVHYTFAEAKTALLNAHQVEMTQAQERLDSARARYTAAQHFNLG